jgi:hypothetical protein
LLQAAGDKSLPAGGRNSRYWCSIGRPCFLMQDAGRSMKCRRAGCWSILSGRQARRRLGAVPRTYRTWTTLLAESRRTAACNRVKANPRGSLIIWRNSFYLYSDKREHLLEFEGNSWVIGLVERD